MNLRSILAWGRGLSIADAFSIILIGAPAEANVWETVFRYYGIDWIALALNATAIYLLGKKKKTGFSFGVVANIAWIVFAVLAHSVATVVACTIFVALNAKGWWNWSHEQAPVEPGKRM